jgi:hypothetical protein
MMLTAKNSYGTRRRTPESAACAGWRCGLALMIIAAAIVSSAASGRGSEVTTPAAPPRLIRRPVSPPTLLPQACGSRTLIGIDPYNNVGYVPVYSLDRRGNAQVAVVDLTVGAAQPVRKLISLDASVQPVAVAFNPSNRTMLVDARGVHDQVFIYEIATATESVEHVVEATGLRQEVETRAKNIWGPVRLQPAAGGMVVNFVNHQAVVLGTTTMGLLDVSRSPPRWDPLSVIHLDLYAESFALNSNTGLLFISNLGTDALIDTNRRPLKEIPFARVPNRGITDGVAFDISTNIVVHAELDGADRAYAFNFNTLDFSQRPATADPIAAPGLGFVSTVGPVPGGQTVINCATHQAIVADGFGPNFRLIQLPARSVEGPLNNRGHPGSGTAADAASVYTIAASAIPAGKTGPPQARAGIIGDPSSLTVDPVRNFAYMLADDAIFYHRWTPGTRRPLFLLRVDLGHPVFGAGPLGGADHKTFWRPTVDVIRMP